MILVRTVFQVKWGKMDEVLAGMAQMRSVPVFRAFYAIDPGMTVEQVDRIMAASLSSETTATGPVRGWHPKTGPTLNSDMLTYRPWDCSDIFYIYFVDGRVTARHFSPD